MRQREILTGELFNSRTIFVQLGSKTGMRAIGKLNAAIAIPDA